MSDQEKCPRCGAVATAEYLYQRGRPSALETIVRRNWKCGSWWEGADGFNPSAICRAAELEVLVERLRAALSGVISGSIRTSYGWDGTTGRRRHWARIEPSGEGFGPCDTAEEAVILAAASAESDGKGATP